MELCNHAVEQGDASGKLEYYCSKYAWRMDLDVIETCAKCPDYT